MFYLLNEMVTWEFLFLGGIKHENSLWFYFGQRRGTQYNKDEADVISMIFDFYIAGASLGKIVDMLYAKQIPSPTGKTKWTRASVDHLLSNGKYVVIIGWEKFLDAQFEKSARCNIDYDQEGLPRRDTRYVSPDISQI